MSVSRQAGLRGAVEPTIERGTGGDRQVDLRRGRAEHESPDRLNARSAGRPNLILIGFMGTGKSSIGRRCARELGFRFRDSDTLIERRAGKPVSAIFAEEGEARFRAMEVEAVGALARQRGVVLATGGGAPMDGRNAAALRASGVVVLLSASPEEIAARCGPHHNRGVRPLLADAADPVARIAELLAIRAPVYRAVAHVVVDTSGLAPVVAAQHVLNAYRREAGRRAEAGAEE